MDKELIKKVMSHLGSIKSDRKAKSSRENGKKGGRPKKYARNNNNLNNGNEPINSSSK